MHANKVEVTSVVVLHANEIPNSKDLEKSDFKRNAVSW